MTVEDILCSNKNATTSKYKQVYNDPIAYIAAGSVYFLSNWTPARMSHLGLNSRGSRVTESSHYRCIGPLSGDKAPFPTAWFICVTSWISPLCMQQQRITRHWTMGFFPLSIVSFIHTDVTLKGALGGGSGIYWSCIAQRKKVNFNAVREIITRRTLTYTIESWWGIIGWCNMWGTA